MNYIVGICGTHGTGKSTILQGVKDFGYPTNETHISREAQRALGWDKLSIAGESVSNMWQLQNAILTAMDHRDEQISAARTPTIVERTPADVWAYTDMWCYRLGLPLDDERVKEYYERCCKMSKRYAKFLVVEPNDKIPFVAEANRADLKSRMSVANAINDFIWSGTLPITLIKSTGRVERVAEAVAVMNHVKVKSMGLI
jgi:predicted ATPase